MPASMKDQAAVGVLVSGGVESAAMLAGALQRYERVYPIYVRKGFIWEKIEMVYLRRLAASFKEDGLAQPAVLEVPAQPIYNPHWALGRKRVPGFNAPDSAVFLPGRNLLLLSLGGLFCAMRKIPTLWLGILKGNPFRDAKAGFIRQMETLLEETLPVPVRIATPLRELSKEEVIRRWPDLPWQHTFSCLSPVNRKHCGRCQKCSERKAGFKKAGVADPTRYAR